MIHSWSPQMNVTIVGASGWASRTIECILSERFRLNQDKMTIYGSKPRIEVFCKDRSYEVRKWENGLMKRTDLFLPFAFATVDKFDKLGKEKYVLANRELIQLSETFIQNNHPRFCLLLSSGITSPHHKLLPRHESYLEYAKLKIEEEYRIREVCGTSGTKVLVAKLYSASGQHMTEPSKFALGNFILQGLQNDKIELASEFPVFRRYVDMFQFLETCLKLLFFGLDDRIDSGGSLVELHQLGKLVAHSLQCDYIENDIDASQEDHYYSTSNEFELRAKKLGVRLYDIEEQVLETIIGVRKLISKKLNN